MENIIGSIRSRYDVSDRSMRKLVDHLVRCSFPKSHLLVREGSYARSAYFIERGMTRSFWMVDGEEFTTSFSTEGGIVFSMDELYYGQPSQEYVETLEEVVAYRIAISDLVRLFETDIEFANWGRIIHQDEYRRIHQSHKERLTMPARERYEAFRNQFPEVCRRARLSLIASYLGITSSTLSRLRRKFSE
ncbi:MAG: Crp/Fnr family transcriptional regulator [Muribaculaceae bacterium]|nr:Crp/Fnr family transcriptional regulator [Muribaculaceae bacterium]